MFFKRKKWIAEVITFKINNTQEVALNLPIFVNNLEVLFMRLLFDKFAMKSINISITIVLNWWMFFSQEMLLIFLFQLLDTIKRCRLNYLFSRFLVVGKNFDYWCNRVVFFFSRPFNENVYILQNCSYDFNKILDGSTPKRGPACAKASELYD